MNPEEIQEDVLSPEKKEISGKLRGVGFTRKNKDQSKKARKQQKLSRRKNRGRKK